jgi:starvation-inducible DNA-binding protein
MQNQKLFNLLANYYALYIKTQSYHWNISGLNFFQFHKMLESQYEKLASEIDEIAEKIKMLGEKVPAHLSVFASLTIISDPNPNFTATEMIKDLYESNKQIVTFLQETFAHYHNNCATQDFIVQKIAAREKEMWFLFETIS